MEEMVVVVVSDGVMGRGRGSRLAKVKAAAVAAVGRVALTDELQPRSHERVEGGQHKVLANVAHRMADAQQVSCHGVDELQVAACGAVGRDAVAREAGHVDGRHTTLTANQVVHVRSEDRAVDMLLECCEVNDPLHEVEVARAPPCDDIDRLTQPRGTIELEGYVLQAHLKLEQLELLALNLGDEGAQLCRIAECVASALQQRAEDITDGEWRARCEEGLGRAV